MDKYKRLSLTILPLFLILLLSSCSTGGMKHAGWTVNVDQAGQKLTILQDSLGTVLQDVTLMIRKEDGTLAPSGKWSSSAKEGALVLTAGETTWTFTADSGRLTVQCNDPAGVLQGVAPAPESRIPARVREQDNGVMYTAYGLVSARGVNHLFDRPTDIMITFPEGTLLDRDVKDPALLTAQIPVSGEGDIVLVPEYYNEVVGLAKHQKTAFRPVYKPIPKRFDRAPTGWSSWYCYYMTTNEDDMVKETDALARLLKPYGLEYVQLDACYTRGEEANWLEWTKETFPHGGKWLFRYILDKGLKPGLWMNPHGDNYAHPSMAKKYPENFYLRDKNGKLSGACCSADRTVVRLDYTNPEVMKVHLRPLFDTLVQEWGLKYLKAGGWGTWMDYYEKNRAQAYDSTLDSRVVYRSVLENIREIMGDTTYLLGCAMHEVGCGFGLFDGSRTGADILAQWAPSKYSGMSMYNFFSSLFGANYLNGICWWSDPDDVQLRPPLTAEEARTIATTISLSGQAYIAGDFIADPPPRSRFKSKIHQMIANALPPDRLEMYRKTMPARPIHAMDLYPYRCEPVVMPHPTSFPRILDLKVNGVAGMYDVAALYNWGDEDTVKSISLLKDLGLAPGGEYLLFDYWNTSLLGIGEDNITLGVPAHGVKALVIHPLQERPLVMATSRHLTGTVSLKEMKWDPDKKVLSGRSEIIKGDPYTLYVYVPEGFSLSKAEASMQEGETTVQVQNNKADTGSWAAITFKGSGTELSWSMKF